MQGRSPSSRRGSSVLEALAGLDLGDARGHPSLSGAALLGAGHVQDVAPLATGGEACEGVGERWIRIERSLQLVGHGVEGAVDGHPASLPYVADGLLDEAEQYVALSLHGRRIGEAHPAAGLAVRPWSLQSLGGVVEQGPRKNITLAKEVNAPIMAMFVPSRV